MPERWANIHVTACECARCLEERQVQVEAEQTWEEDDDLEIISSNDLGWPAKVVIGLVVMAFLATIVLRTI